MSQAAPVKVLPLVTCFGPWVKLELPHHTVRGSGEPIFPASYACSDCGHCGFTIFTVPAVGLRAGLAS